MKSSMKTSWRGKMAFDSLIGEHVVRTDASEKFGGDNSAASPKSLMMVALAGCTGVDVVTILQKMRVELSGFDIDVECELTDEIPSTYTKMHLIYSFKGKALDPAKLKKAIELSQDKYCGVSAMYRKVMEISWEMKVDAE